MTYHTSLLASLLDSEGNNLGVIAIITPAEKIKGISNRSLSDGQKQNPEVSLNKMLRLAIENTDERFDEISSKEYWRFWN